MPWSKEKKREYNKNYREKNKEHVKQANKKWNEENREKKREYSRRWIEKNKELINEKKEYAADKTLLTNYAAMYPAV